MPPRRVLGPGGRRRLGPAASATKSVGAGGGGSSKAAGGARVRGKIAVLKKTEKFGFILPLTDDDEGPQKKLYFSYADCDCDPARLKPYACVTYAPPAAGTDRASHVELDLGGHLDGARFGHVDSILTNVRSHEHPQERTSFAACDLTQASTFCLALSAPQILLSPNEVCEVLARDDLPLKAVEGLLRALASTDAAEAAGGAARAVYQTCARSPLLLSGRGARAVLLRAGSRRADRAGDAAMLGAVAAVVSACLDADRSCYAGLQDLLEGMRDLVDERKREASPEWVAARTGTLAVLKRAAALRSDAKRLTGTSDADFRSVAPFPSRRDVTLSRPLADVAKNQVSGRQDSAEAYVATHFHLLRADFLGPLRDGLKAAWHGESSRDVDVYRTCALRGIIQRRGVLHRFECAGDREPWAKQSWARASEGQRKGRLMTGALVIVTDPATLGEATWVCAVVRARELRKDRSLVVDLAVDEARAHSLDFGKAYSLVECTATYFEAYRWVLYCLQASDLEAFSQNRVLRTFLKLPEEPPPPEYIFPTDEYVFGHDRRRVLEDAAWPEKWGSLDASQASAVRRALTKSVAVIQGPPGTGKTHVGMEVMRLMLANVCGTKAKQPFVVMCATNHALDAFLEGVLAFESNIVRVGGRSSCAVLQDKNLRELSKQWRKNDERAAEGSLLGAQHVCGRRALYGRLKTLEETITTLAKRAHALSMGATLVDLEQWLREGSDDDDFDEKGVTEEHLRSLCARPSKDVLATWLETDAPAKLLVQPPDVRGATQVEPVVVEPEDPDAVDAKASMADEADDAPRRREAVFIDVGPAPFIQAGNRKARRRGKRGPDAPPPGAAGDDLWSWPVPQRRQAWAAWGAAIHRRRVNELRSCAARAERTRREMERLDRDVDAEVLRGAKVVGLTTTSVAKRRDLLRLIGAEVLICEEAAEVLEAHVLAAVSSTTKHVVLIGDHEQLRPGTAVYKLATEYNLDVSLFERLVKNGVRATMLETQRRMRPGISRFVKAIYPNLKDHSSVKERPAIRGLQKDVFFLSHQNAEAPGSASKQNFAEASLVVAFCRYLVRGTPRYGEDRITVLATYVAQVGALRRKLQSDGLPNVRVASVDNFQGEENDIILLSLVRNDGRPDGANHKGATIGFLATSNRVCVALTRARNGLFIFGNAGLLSARSKLWKDALDDLRGRGGLGGGLPLVPRFREGDAAVRYASSARGVEAVLEDVGELCASSPLADGLSGLPGAAPLIDLIGADTAAPLLALAAATERVGAVQLPPTLDAQQRRAVHVFCGGVGLLSTSAGEGDARRITCRDAPAVPPPAPVAE